MAFPSRCLAAAALFTALALSGCSKLKLGYEYADWLFIYSVEDNFDLDKSQRAKLKDGVEDYFRWHRKQMLPQYIDYLSFISDSLKAGLKISAIDSGYKRYQSLFQGTMAPLVDRAVPLLQSLAPDQVDAWLQRRRKKTQKLRKDFSGSLEERLENRNQKIVDELEDWTGRLSKDQKERIRALDRALPWNGMLWLDTRAKMEEHLADLLKRKAPEDSLRGYLHAYYVEPDSLRSEEYRAKYREFETRLRGMIYAIYNLLTPEQRAHFIQQVDKQAQDLRSLLKQE